ncbi:MAG TPA: cation:proton antiporter [Woeseiaceae bacterium]|nr:cation:proton antiporter [Woeseiaceae bacterium]
MSIAAWFLVVGAVLLFMAFSASRIQRMPLSTAIVYLAVGVLLGPIGADQFHFNPLEQSALLEVLTEIAVLISLFAAGLKLAAPVGDRMWWPPFRLATVSMVLTVGLTAAAGAWLLGLSLGAAVLLGAVLAPTDPVLASEVQVRDVGDRDRLRFALTGEAGLNDGTAFPMVMLGLGLLGLHELGEAGARWWLVDVAWACSAGIAVGGALGMATAWVMHRLAERGKKNRHMENFAGLGLIAFAYGLSLLIESYGFLAVFAAGFMLHRGEAWLTPAEAGSEADANSRPVYMTRVSLNLVEHFERLFEVALLLLIGGMLFADSWQATYVAMALLLLFVIRPLSVFLGLAGSGQPFRSQVMIAWFGVKGIGSLYYLMYAIQHGVEGDLAVTLVSVVVVVVALSVVLHGISATPLMRLYARTIRE